MQSHTLGSIICKSYILDLKTVSCSGYEKTGTVLKAGNTDCCFHYRLTDDKCKLHSAFESAFQNSSAHFFLHMVGQNIVQTTSFLLYPDSKGYNMPRSKKTTNNNFLCFSIYDSSSSKLSPRSSGSSYTHCTDKNALGICCQHLYCAGTAANRESFIM